MIVAITGSDRRAITGSDRRAITGSDRRAITGSDRRAITGSDRRAITGSDRRAITGSDRRAITGSDRRAITGSDRRLLIVGQVSFVGRDFISVLGQSVFIDRANAGSIAIGSSVQVYGSMNADGGIEDASVVAADGADGGSYLTGVVDSVDYAKGTAVVSGVEVDYNATLANGTAPNVGDMVSVTGRHYRDSGKLVADPQMR